MEKLPKGMSEAECMDRASEFIGRNGMCLLLMDLVGSRNHPDPEELFREYEQLLEDLNAEFGDHLPVNDLAVHERQDQGFGILIGDGSGAGIDSSDIIPQVIEFAANNYPGLSLRYAVAEDGYDEEGVRLIK